MGKKLATNFLAFGIKMTPSAVLVLKVTPQRGDFGFNTPLMESIRRGGSMCLILKATIALSYICVALQAAVQYKLKIQEFAASRAL